MDCSPAATIRLVNQHATVPSSSDATKILLGYSMGARAALLHAVEHPTHWDALILISGNPGIEDAIERKQRAAQDATLAQRITADGAPEFLKFWQETPLIRSQQQIRPDWLRTMQRNRRQQTADGLAASLQQFGPAACPNLWPQLHTLNCPILLISGEHDSKYCALAQRMRLALPNAHWITIAQTGHMPHLESPEATAKAIREFIKRL